MELDFFLTDWGFVEITEKIKEQILSRPIFKGKIVSGSMVPVIMIGEEITVIVKERNLKRFDIIVFLSEGKLVCHYLWRMNEIVTPRLMQTRSMLGGTDLPIEEKDYIGKVVSHHLSKWRKIKLLFF
jgi:signal peptidase I